MDRFKKALIWGLIILGVLFSPILLVLGGVATSIIVTVMAGLAVILLPVAVIALVGYFIGRRKNR